MADPMTDQQFQDWLDEEERRESGGGIIAQAKFEMGMKAFISETTNEDTWFPYVPGDEASRLQALSKAKVAIRDAGSTSRPQASYGFIVKKNTVKGREVTWQGDRWFVYPVWTQAAKEVVRPALRELGIFVGTFWGRWAWVDDPSGRTELDQEGNERVRLIAYPAERYASEAEAEEAAGGGTTGSVSVGGSGVPLWLTAYAKEKGITVQEAAAEMTVSVDGEKL